MPRLITPALARRALRPLSALALLAGVAAGAGLAAQRAEAAVSNDPSGVWLTEDGKARIRIEKCGATNTNICGYAVWLKTPLNERGEPRVDFRNPDPKKRTRASLGHQLIMGLKPNADGRYEGKIYNAEDGKFYDVTIWSEQPTELSVRGCLLAILCGSQTWARTTDLAPGQLAGSTNAAGGPRADAEWAPKAATTAAATTGSAGKAVAAKAGAPKTGAAKPGAEPDAAAPAE